MWTHDGWLRPFGTVLRCIDPQAGGVPAQASATCWGSWTGSLTAAVSLERRHLRGMKKAAEDVGDRQDESEGWRKLSLVLHTLTQ